MISTGYGIFFERCASNYRHLLRLHPFTAGPFTAKLPVILAERYQVLQPLAQGGFGKTFLACDRHLPGEPKCVIKQLKPITTSPEVYQVVQDRFQREAAILEQIGENHSQIPRLYAYY